MDVANHMMSEHGVKGRLERLPAAHQCPQCPYEDHQKGKLTRHKVGCDKRFRPERNMEPPHDFEPPAKVPKPVVPASHGLTAGSSPYGNRGMRPGNAPHPAAAGFMANAAALNKMNMQGQQQRMPQLQFGPGGRNAAAAAAAAAQQFGKQRQGGMNFMGRNNQAASMAQQAALRNQQVVLQALNQQQGGQQQQQRQLL